MNTLRMMTITIMMALAGSVPALAAVDTSRTYSSGLLIGLFIAFCALVVVVQMIPSIMMLMSFVRGLVRGTDAGADVAGR